MTDVNASPNSEFMRIKTAAIYLQVSEWLLWKRLQQGRLKRYKFDGGSLTYLKRSELDALMVEAK